MSSRRLDLPCGNELPRLVAEFVEEIADAGGVERDRWYWLRLAADEITTNIAHHGYGDGPGELLLEGGADEAKIWITIADSAPPFDPREHDYSQQLAIHPAERDEGGLGIMLALRKLDEFDYQRRGAQNINVLVMRLDEPADAAGQGEP